MNNCKEFLLDDVMAIVAIPLGDLELGTSSWQLTPTILDEEYYPTLYNAITIGQQSATAGGILIPIRRLTGKAKDEESDNVAGRLHTVTVTCDVDDRDHETWNHLRTLERTPCHLQLTFRDNSRAFVSATEDTYLCNVERDGAKTTTTFRVQNLMGLQRIVDSF